MENNNITVLVCCHKKDYWHDGPGFLPIQVGKAISSIDLNIVADDTGDNISSKNPYYCELTALYWYWKNCTPTKYVGLNHYRRYFDFSSGCKWGIARTSLSEDKILSNPPNLEVVENLLKKYDIILPKPLVSQFPISIQYSISHISNDLKILEEAVKKVSPEYMEAYNKVLNGNKFSPYNMFITKNTIFIKYVEWLFKVLSEVEKHLKISAYPDQARVFGYLSERLMSVFVTHHCLKVKYVPILKVSDEPGNNRIKEITLNGLKTIFAKTYLLAKNVK